MPLTTSGYMQFLAYMQATKARGWIRLTSLTLQAATAVVIAADGAG